MQLPRCLLTQGHFGAIHAIDARITARSLMGHLNQHAWDEAQLHQTMGKDFGKLKAIKDGGLAEGQMCQGLQASSIGDYATECQSAEL